MLQLVLEQNTSTYCLPFSHNIPFLEAVAIPPIGNFSEKDEAEAGGEYFKDRIEQFELVVSGTTGLN